METQKLSTRPERKLSIDSEPRTLTKEELAKARVCLLCPHMCSHTHLSTIYVGKLLISSSFFVLSLFLRVCLCVRGICYVMLIFICTNEEPIHLQAAAEAFISRGGQSAVSVDLIMLSLSSSSSSVYFFSSCLNGRWFTSDQTNKFKPSVINPSFRFCTCHNDGLLI